MGNEVTCEVGSLAVAFPDACACCMGPPRGGTMELAVTPTDADAAAAMATGSQLAGAQVDVPFCAACRKHVRAHGQLWTVSAVPGAVVAGLMLWRSGFDAGTGPIVGAMAAGTVATVALRYLLLPSLFAGRGERCCDSDVAVACMGPLGSGGYRFHFSNERFGREFKKLNGR